MNKLFYFIGIILIASTAWAVSAFNTKVATSNPHTWTNGLVGYWSFDGKYTTSTDGTADVSGTGNYGQFKNGVKPVAGVVGQALSFDGIDDYVNLGNPDSLQITDELTIEYWVKFDSTQPSARFCNPIGKDHSGTEGVTLQIDHTDVAAPFSQYWHVGHGAGIYSLNYGTPTLLDDTWHHLVLTKGLTAGMAIYLDGAVVSSNNSYTKAIVYDTSDWNFGREATIATRICKMIGDELRFYNRALSAGEIKQHYEQSRRNFVVSTPNPHDWGEGLVGYWDFNGQNIVNSTSTDQSVEGNDGTIVGAIPAAGVVGQALSFDGVNDRVIITNNATLNFGTGDFSIETWIKARVGGGSPQRIVSKQSAAWYFFRLSTGRISGDIKDGTNQVTSNGGADLRDGKWHYVAMSIDRDSVTGMKMYVDGIVVDTDDPTGVGSVTNTVDLQIGRFSGGIEYFNGLMDEVRIYNRALSADEVKMHYEQTRRNLRL